MELLSQLVNSSFKYILLGMNLLTIVVVYVLQSRRVYNKQHHILFVFAHPDDQAMFFGPTLLSLVPKYYVHFLCLSSGNTHRSQQLAQSAKFFKIHRQECIHDQKMIDGMQSKWDEETIRQHVKRYVQEHNIKAIFTFDHHGVSGHINHRTIYHALSKLEVQPRKQANGEGQPQGIKIYYLESTNIFRKYSGPIELIIVPFKEFSFVRLNYFHGVKAMVVHKSQFVWFRRLFVLFSRYTYINTFQMRRVKFD